MITSSNQMKTFCLSLKFVFIYKYFKIKNLVSQSRTLTLSHTLFRSLPITHAYNHKALMSLTSQLTVDPPHKRCLTTFTHKQRQTHRASSLSWQQEICRHKDKLFREGGVAHMSPKSQPVWGNKRGFHHRGIGSADVIVLVTDHMVGFLNKFCICLDPSELFWWCSKLQLH